MAKKKLNFNYNPLLSGPSLSSRSRMGSPYREIAVAEIDVDPDQPRRAFATESLAELAASIKEYGVLCPILVRVAEAGTYRLISGERRLRAAKLAGLESIPAVVDQKEEGSDSILARQLVENLQRQDLSPMERALAIGQLRDLNNWSVREIGRRLGLSKSFVQRSLEILSLPEDLQTALISGAAESKILLLAQLKDREMRKELLARMDSLSREELETEIAVLMSASEKDRTLSHSGTGDGAKARKSLSPEDQNLIMELQRTLGIKVSLLRKAGKADQGKLVLEFYSMDDLKELFRRLIEGSRHHGQAIN